jgi:hypothetical protein
MIKIEMRRFSCMMGLEHPKTSDSFAAHTLGILPKQLHSETGYLGLEGSVVYSF